ncbi:hypothetical protein BKA56DRAFT_585734 [Ilyonectria sp. MPI-CAGE-AT-0026]|nr:hypothetical protein BKA56DRAFT_585734 [Ilyonectria sp. MPI-CAGE-AT-0026]
MTSPEATTAILTVDDIAALRNAELCEFIKKHRRPNGGFGLPVDGWDKLSKDERNQLAERLKAQGRALAQSPTAYSRPLDLDALDARLRDVSDASSPSARDRTSRRTRRITVSPPDFVASSRGLETKAYHDLVNDGSRPLYTIDRLEQVFQNPDDHRDMIYPWDGRDRPRIWELYWQGGSRHFELFQTQLARWRDFRRWQNDNRWIEEDDEGGFPAYLESMRHKWEWLSHKDEYDKWLAEVEADPSSIMKDWDFEVFKRDEQRYHCGERGCDGFPQYAEAVKRRLAQHDFTRPCHLHEDPKQQDALTTWIEYLNFEYWWLYRHTRAMESMRSAHDKAWQELLDLKVLRPHESQKFLQTMASLSERQAEEEQAREAVKRAGSEGATVYRMTQKDPQRSSIPKAKRMSMLGAATNKLNAAKGRLKLLERRSSLITDLIRWTHGYDRAKRDAARQRSLVQWVLEQVPLIEAEVGESQENEAGSGTNKKKRRPVAEEDGSENPRRKKQKVEQRALASAPSHRTTITPEAGEAQTDSAIDHNEVLGSQTDKSPAKRPIQLHAPLAMRPRLSSQSSGRVAPPSS